METIRIRDGKKSDPVIKTEIQIPEVDLSPKNINKSSNIDFFLKRRYPHVTGRSEKIMIRIRICN
jgi:hypothetical protein